PIQNPGEPFSNRQRWRIHTSQAALSSRRSLELRRRVAQAPRLLLHGVGPVFLNPSVTVFEREVPALLFTRALPLDILLRHHVQLSIAGQLSSLALPLPPFHRLHKLLLPPPSCHEPRGEYRA